VEPITIRTSRWRCDHGWDIDLDDGASNYHIYNNLCLNGGIKNREGYRRIVENNVIVNNTFHPHCWFAHSGDVFRRNIVFVDEYRPARMPSDRAWGTEMDDNLVHQPGDSTPHPALGLAAMSHRDAASIVADACFVDPASGDYRVAADSPAIRLGFANFPMDRFGVVSPRLKAIARTPEIPRIAGQNNHGEGQAPAAIPGFQLGARVRDINGPGDRSAYGLPDETGVLVIDAPPDSVAHRGGLMTDDVIVSVDSQAVRTGTELARIVDHSKGKTTHFIVIRQQKKVEIDVMVPLGSPSSDR